MKRRAFTLIELLIVIAVLIILVAVTLPRVKYAIDESKLRESSRQFNSYLAMAKSRAASTGRPCGVWIERDLQNANPTIAEARTFYLAETPLPYTGDFLTSTAYMTDSGSGYWVMNFPQSDSTYTILLTDPEDFQVRFDHKGPLFQGRYTGGQMRVFPQPTRPPTSNGMAGYSFEVIRQPKRVGQALSLPQGTCVDLAYSGVGNTGTEFQAMTGYSLLMFSPDGHLGAASIDGTPLTNANKVHLLIGRPEKLGNAIPQSNLADNNALWVSVGALTGTVTTTDNSVNNSLPFGTAAEQQTYLFEARTFARTGDVKGGN